MQASANVILTNPDMLHAAVLPDHHLYGRIIRSLRFLVIDEAHVYRGAFGAHVAGVVRRLFRLCRLYENADLQVICCSATLANPVEHFWQLVPNIKDQVRELCVIGGDGSPHGKRVFVLWNPVASEIERPASSSDDPAPASVPALAALCTDASGTENHSNLSMRAQSEIRLLSEANEGKTQQFRSPILITGMIMAALVKLHVRTLAFASVRKVAELVCKYARENLEDAPHLVDMLYSYRSGYTKASCPAAGFI